MSYTFDRKSSFSIEGSRWRRLNPDGSYPAVDNTLGFVGTIDVSALVAGDIINYRLGATGAFVPIVVAIDDVTATYVNSAAATVAELVTALNADAIFAALFTASADADTGRLKIVELAATATYLEFRGNDGTNIVPALELGSFTGNTLGFGTHFIDCFNNSGALGLPKEIKDFEEIDVETGDGGLLSMVTAALLKGLNPSLALTDELYELKALIQGGSIDETVAGVEARYSPPTTSQVYLPLFAGEAYEAKYGKGSNNRNSMTGYKRVNFNNCNGIEGDLADEVKSWAAYQFNLRVREYVIGSTKYPGYTEDSITLAQFDTLGITVG